MTILAKPFSEKKGDKLVVPLVDNEHLPPPTAPEDIESGEAGQRPRIIIFPARDRISAATTLCLLFTALSVVGVGIIGGKLLYNEYFSVESQSRNYQVSRNFHEKAGSFLGYAQVPLNEDGDVDESEGDNLFTGNEKWSISDDPELQQILKGFLPEKFEINDDKKYEKIYVPDFRDGRSGRFIHDFNTNMTGQQTVSLSIIKECKDLHVITHERIMNEKKLQILQRPLDRSIPVFKGFDWRTIPRSYAVDPWCIPGSSVYVAREFFLKTPKDYETA